MTDEHAKAIGAVDDLFFTMGAKLDETEGVVQLLQSELEARTTERDEVQATLAQVQASYLQLDMAREAEIQEVNRIRGLMADLQDDLDAAHIDLAEEHRLRDTYQLWYEDLCVYSNGIDEELEKEHDLRKQAEERSKVLSEILFSAGSYGGNR